MGDNFDRKNLDLRIDEITDELMMKAALTTDETELNEVEESVEKTLIEYSGLDQEKIDVQKYIEKIKARVGHTSTTNNSNINNNKMPTSTSTTMPTWAAEAEA